MTAHHQTALALADAAELALWCADLRDDATAAIDADPLAGVEDDEWPAGSALPWEREPTPCTRRSRFDVGVSADRLALAREVLS